MWLKQANERIIPSVGIQAAHSRNGACGRVSLCVCVCPFLHIVCIFYYYFLLLLQLFCSCVFVCYRQPANTGSREGTTWSKTETSFSSNLTHQTPQRKSDTRQISLFTCSIVSTLGAALWRYAAAPTVQQPPPPPPAPKHGFGKLWQLCYLRSGSAPHSKL